MSIYDRDYMKSDFREKARIRSKFRKSPQGRTKSIFKIFVYAICSISVIIVLAACAGAYYFISDPYNNSLEIENHLGDKIEVEPINRTDNTFTFKRIVDNQIFTVEIKKLNTISADTVRLLPVGSSRLHRAKLFLSGLSISENEQPIAKEDSNDQVISPKEQLNKVPKNLYKVTKVIDGDTVEVSLKFRTIRVRLEGIDAPEHSQKYGSKATRALKDKISRQDVTMKSNGTDVYGRTVATIFLDDESVNHWMLRNGHAMWYREYSSDVSLMLAQRKAKSEKLGLWAATNPTPPWEYRKWNN
jgi:micrococcal nuclease